MSRVRALIERMHPRTVNIPLIRIGGNNDGGYLVPDDFAGIAACFSPGVGPTITFEKSIADRGIECWLADASVPGLPITHSLFHFDKKFVGVVDDEQTTTLDRWVGGYAPAEGDLLLQMDIEGAEWPVLINVSDAVLDRIRILVLELHSMHHLLDDFAFPFMTAMLDRLLRRFHVVHVHPNNDKPPIEVGGLSIPRIMEITFLRRDRAEATGYATAFPHPLDQPNFADRVDFALPPAWFRKAF